MADLIPGLPEEVARECLIRVSYDLFGSIRSVCKLWREELQSPLFHRLRRSENLLRTVVAAAQATTTEAAAEGPDKKSGPSAASYRISVLDPLSGSWTALRGGGNLPLFCQLAAVGKKLVVIGGWDPDTWAPSDGVLIYDFLSCAWRRGAKLPGPRRSFFACVADGGSVYVAGGHDAEKNALKSAIRYDVDTDTWTSLPDMVRERDECKGIFIGGKFHVVGGYSTDSQGQFGKCAEAFDVSSGRWDPVEEERLEAATCPRTCVADREGRMWMVRSGHVAAEVGGRWKDVAEVPEDAAVVAQLVTWQEKMLLVGSGSHGGAQVGYLLEEANNNKVTWQKIAVPEEYSGNVQAACCLEI